MGNDPSSKEYASVQVHDDDDDDEDLEQEVFEDDLSSNSNGNAVSIDGTTTYQNGRDGRQQKQRRRLPPLPAPQGSQGSALMKAWMVMLGFLIVIGGGLLIWQKREFRRNHSKSVDASVPNIERNGDNDDDGDDDDHHVATKIQDSSATAAAAAAAARTNPPPPEPRQYYPVHYDKTMMENSWNPFNLDGFASSYASVDGPPHLEWLGSGGAIDDDDAAAAAADDDNDDDDDLPNSQSAYLTQPHMVNGTLVFVAEGDLYLTRHDKQNQNNKQPMPAMKITTTTGNVRSPILHPTLPVVAYTATYTGRREIYLQDLRSRVTTRLTYWDGAGVFRVAAWKDDRTLIFAASSNAVGLPDIRLYELTLAQGQQQEGQQPVVMEISPVPLAQARDGAFADGCVYFTRTSQSSQTVRYVGGTVPNLWAYCNGQELALPLTANYVGTSQQPVLWEGDTGDDGGNDNGKRLLFLSDRSLTQGEEPGTWTPATMNLWQMVLPSEEDLYDGGPSPTGPVPRPLTSVSCQFGGRAVQEYTVDAVTGDAVLRVGADLYLLTAQEMNKHWKQTQPKNFAKPQKLPIVVYSDFQGTQERMIPVNMLTDLSDADTIETRTSDVSMVVTMRGQSLVLPIVDDTSLTKVYQGAGQNMPQRRYRLVPGALTGGSMRVLTTRVIPRFPKGGVPPKPLAIVLATDPLSPTAEHAFYMVEVDGSTTSQFADLDHLPLPFLGGHVNGGSVADGGLGSVRSSSFTISPCGRRMAWTDTDGRICVMTTPLYKNETASYTVLPTKNELGEPMYAVDTEVKWSPGGRYLAVNHAAANQFLIYSVVDCGDPDADGLDKVADIQIGRIAQVTPSRFNSFDMYWGTAGRDKLVRTYGTLVASALGLPAPDQVSTTMYFLTDRNIMTDVRSPWGSRAPLPHFPFSTVLYALPLIPKTIENDPLPKVPLGRFGGGGATEAFVDELEGLMGTLAALQAQKEGAADATGTPSPFWTLSSRRLARDLVAQGIRDPQQGRLVQRVLEEKGAGDKEEESVPETAPATPPRSFPVDMDIDFGPADLTFARRAYRMANVPMSKYSTVLAQTDDDGSLVLVDATDEGSVIKIFSPDGYPSDDLDTLTLPFKSVALSSFGLSTDRQYIYFTLAPTGITKVIPNKATSLASAVGDLSKGIPVENIVDTEDLALSVWPHLEYRQMYNDAWRMLRDYFYDRQMHQVDWPEIHRRYASLVQRCVKREDLDDALSQMAAELSALHVFVYGGEYDQPFGGSDAMTAFHAPASLGASLKRTAEWKGYMITEIPQRDPDYNMIETTAVYSPLSEQSLRLSGQKGLSVGDVIVGVNGESVFRVPDINMLLRGKAAESVRLEVLRLESGAQSAAGEAIPEPVIVVPITQSSASNLRYDAWEWKTRQLTKELSAKAGFSVGYIHMRSMGTRDMDAFARGFFEDYDKQGLILDVRHNLGGNIDSWISGMLERKAWDFWGNRIDKLKTGDLDWDQQFAFRGHVVILIDEHTSSDGEGISRSLSDLGIGRLVGKRTWGGGIWLSSDNVLVDGGIATAPEFGTYNAEFGWGSGIEQMGVSPDVAVDNNPRTSFDGIDTQLETGIAELKKMLKKDPVVIPNPPTNKPDMALHGEICDAK